MPADSHVSLGWGLMGIPVNTLGEAHAWKKKRLLLLFPPLAVSLKPNGAKADITETKRRSPIGLIKPMKEQSSIKDAD